jgi:putative radical SAM enzyme (TIGR03279 family)
MYFLKMNKCKDRKVVRKIPGIRVKTVSRHSPGWRAGIRANDSIEAVDGEPVEDDLDFMFLSAAESVTLSVRRKDKFAEIELHRRSGEFLGLDFHDPQVQQCRNRCIFCFIDQMPPGLRRSLYVKDEDYRFSFLNGNYLTLCSTSDAQLQKIIDRGVSPLYVSVHATDPQVRQAMLRNRFAGRILSQLKALEQGGIAFHTQIVVCPGVNDGKVLQQSIRELLRFSSGLQSIALVPVGLTRHRDVPLAPVTPEVATQVCELGRRLGDADAQRRGFRRLFVADEFFIKAGEPLPPAAYYADYPQIENGVGLLRQLQEEWRGLRRTLQKGRAAVSDVARKTSSPRPRQTLLLTGLSAEPFLSQIIKQMQPFIPSAPCSVVPVVNHFFGPSVTVAGLLTARDIIATVRHTPGSWNRVVLPASMFNHHGHTLDGYSRSRISRTLGMPVAAAGTLRDLLDIIGVRKGNLS